MSNSERYPKSTYAIDFTADELLLDYKSDVEALHSKNLKLSECTAIDRSNRYEVHEFIKQYMIARKCTMLCTFRKIEFMIANDAPESKNTCIKLKKWLDENLLV